MRSIKGEGTIFFDKRRKKYVFQEWYTNGQGEKKRKTFVSIDRKELKKRIETWKSEIEKGVLLTEPEKNVAELTDIWLSAIKNSLQPSTFNLYKSMMKNFVVPQFGNRTLESLHPMEIKRWINRIYLRPSKNTKQLSARTCNVIRNTWRTMAAWAVKNGFALKNPLNGVRLLKEEPREIRSLNREELNKLLNEAKLGTYYSFTDDPFGEYLQKEIYVAVVLAARTGMRRGEVFGLCWPDMELNNSLIHVRHNLMPNGRLSTPKTRNSVRNILLDTDTVAILKTWRSYQARYMNENSGIVQHMNNLVFTSQVGTPFSVNNFRSRQWKMLTDAAGLPGLGFHSLRHTHATQLIASGVPVKVVSERLGHKDVAMTMRIYVSVLPTMQQMAVDVIEKWHKNTPTNVAPSVGAKKND
ncbi:MAG: site-specific integrase [Acidaminococcus sp.]|jgi:integrase|nr:site-specific integrase [Acidaminococcus sp.]